MNDIKYIRNKIRRKTEQRKQTKIEFDFSKEKLSKMNYCNSQRNKRKSNNNSKNISSKQIYHYNNQNKLYENDISMRLSRYGRSNFNAFRKSIENNNNYCSKRKSLELIQTKKTKKFYQKYNLKVNGKKIFNKNSPREAMARLSNYELNKLEHNIKNALNNMRIEIEKQAQIKENVNTISPRNQKKNKLTSSPDLKFFFKKKKVKNSKKNLQSSLLLKETHITDYSFKSEDKKKRNRSLDLSEKAKKKLLLQLKNKIYKKSNEIQRMTIINTSLSEDSDNNNENYKGFALMPTSNIIFTFDLLLIIADLYTFINIPLTVAKNKDVREKGPIIQEIIHYIIDLIFLLDFILSFFRGFYDFEMNIIRNNKKIICKYLQNYFIFDFLQAIPLYTMIRIFMKPNKFFILGYSGKESIIISFLLFIKPFKIFKIIQKKQNQALEDFYSYLSENYFLEQLASFMMYFLIFFLFIHLFICLHIYFSFQSYPNWINHTNIINKSFIEKYIASLYFMITTMTTVGYGDIVCISFIERIYHIILLVIGTLLYTFLVSKIGNYLRDQSYEEIKLNKDLNILENIRITYPTMTFKLYSKIKNHLLSIFKKRKKTGISLLINGVPDAIKNDLLFKIYKKVINEFRIFKDVKNSNFILQVLTNFIPIISKKEEIIIFQGEIIQNIVFVKDGRLSLEISIDLNDPYKSIQNYLDDNLKEIQKKDEVSSNKYLISSARIMKERNYNDLKEEIDNILQDNKNTLVNNSRIDNNGISVDLGRLDFSRNEKENNNDNYHIIKIIDVRKNEHYGDVHLIMEKPSPFTLKAKSRIAELLLLRKHNAIMFSKNFPNIWKKIQNKSYHNLVSIKKLTLKILKRYYNTYFYNKSKREYITNLDVTKASGRSFLDIPSFIRNNMNKSINNKNSNKSNLNIKNKETKNSFNKNKLFIGYGTNRKISSETFSNEISFSSDSYASNSLNISHFNNISNSNINKNESLKIIDSKEKENQKLNPINKSKTKCSKFNSSNDKNNLNTNLHNNNKLNCDNNLKNKSEKNISPKSSINETIPFFQNNEKIENNNNKKNFVTLEDMDHNFSKRIKKKLKKRTKIEKLKATLKVLRQINKNLLKTLLKHNIIENNDDEEIIEDSNLIHSLLSSNEIRFSKLMESFISEGVTSTITKNNPIFDLKSLKIVSSESFKIKSYYQNINSLSKGNMIRNEKYKKNIENIIKTYINENKENKHNQKLLSSLSPKNKNKKEKSNLKFNKTEINNKNIKIHFSEDNINRKFKTIILNNKNHLLNKNNNFDLKKRKVKFQKDERDKKLKKNEKQIENFQKIKQNTFKDKDFVNKEKKDYIENSIYKENIEEKYLKNIKKEKKKKKEINNDICYNEINNKTIKSSIIPFNENDKFYNSTNENKLSILNKNKICSKNIQPNIINNEKEKNCYIY